MTYPSFNRRAALEFATMSVIASVSGASSAQAPSGTKAPSDVSVTHIHPPAVPLPHRTCDCHVHVFDPARFPYVMERTYTPGTATIDDLLAFEGKLGVDRVVLVQPSGYGTDNRCLLDALMQLGPARARGVAVIDLDRTTAKEMDALHEAGVRSIRLNLEVKGEHSVERSRATLHKALQLVAPTRWSIQIYADLALIEGLAAEIRSAKTPIVLDHFAGLKADKGMAQAGWSSVLELLKEGSVYVKLSAPYRASKLADYSDLAPFVRTFAETAPERLVWASDWPHTGSASNRSGDLSVVEPFRAIDGGDALNKLRAWIPEPSIQHQIFVTNPAALYSFGD